MNDWRYFFDHVPGNLEKGTYRIFEPEWKAEILHWFSREDIPKEQKEEFVNALLNFDDGCGNFYRYRAFFLASEALAYFPECSLGDAIVKQLLDWSYLYFGWKIFTLRLRDAAREALELTDKQRVIAAFVCFLHHTENRLALRWAAEKLGKLDRVNKNAIAALLLLLQVTQDSSTQIKAIRSLEEIASGNEIAIATLINLMQTTQDKRLYYRAIDSLGKIGFGNQTAISYLVEFLQINRGDNICLRAAKALWQIDPGNPAAIDTLVEIIATTRDAVLLGKAAKYLVEKDPANLAAVAALIERIESCQDTGLLFVSAFYLGEFDRGNKLTDSTITQIIQTTQDNWTSYLVYEDLDIEPKFSPHNKIAIAAFLQILETSENELRRLIAAELLLQIDPSNQTAISSMWHIFESSENEWRRLICAENLLQIEPNNRIIINALLQILETAQDKYIRLQVIKFLLQTEEYRQKAIDSLINWIKTNEDEEFLFWLTGKLEELDLVNKIVRTQLDQIIAIFVRLMQTHKDSNYESCLCFRSDFLKEILPNDYLPQVIKSLKNYLSEQFYKRSSYRYEAAFNIIWHCAENMNYPAFYQAWHN